MKRMTFFIMPLFAATIVNAQSDGTATTLSAGGDLESITSTGIVTKVSTPDTIKSLSFGTGAGEGPVLEFGLNADVTWRNEIWFTTGLNPQKNSLVLNVEFSDTSIKSAYMSLYERETWDSAGDLVFISSIKDGFVKVTSIKELKPNTEYLAIVFTQKED